jgi:hypothetical protein
LGHSVIGPAGSVNSALDLLLSPEALPDAALLDVNVRERRVTPVAQACHELSVPFALVTGYGRLQIEEDLLQPALRVRKPFDGPAIARVLAELLSATSGRQNPDRRIY